MRQTLKPGRLSLVSMACGVMLAACGGGGESDSSGRMQAISFDYPGGAMLASGSYTLTAMSTSGLPVTFGSTTPDICTVSGNQMTPVKVGECRVTAQQAGGASADGVKWAPADDASHIFTVLKRPQIIAIVGPEYVASATTSSVTLSTMTTSGEPAVLSGGTPGVCTLSGNTLTILGKGSCAVSASHPGNDNHAPAIAAGFIGVDPVVFAEGITPAGQGSTRDARTSQNGAVTVNPWSSITWGGWEWCENTNDNCFRTVSDDGRTFTSALHVPRSAWTPGNWQSSFNRVDIFGPGLSGFNDSGDTVSGVQVTTETAMALQLGVNAGLFMAARPVTVTVELGKRNNGCNPALTATLQPAGPAVFRYAIPLTAFNVANACDLSGTAVDLFKGSNVVRVRLHINDINLQFRDTAASTYFGTDLSISGSIRFQ